MEKRAEVAYRLGPDFWGHGYGVESLTWLHAHIISVFDIREFWATAMPGNRRSIRLHATHSRAEANRMADVLLEWSGDPGILRQLI